MRAQRRYTPSRATTLPTGMDGATQIGSNHASQTKLLHGLTSSRVATIFAVSRSRQLDRTRSYSHQFSYLWVGRRPMRNSYLFVNPKYAGKYLPPTASKWFNYGGDKFWPLPDGNNDEQHWAGGSDILDDGSFTFRKISEGPECTIELTGPQDPQTGIQFLRAIRID